MRNVALAGFDDEQSDQDLGINQGSAPLKLRPDRLRVKLDERRGAQRKRIDLGARACGPAFSNYWKWTGLLDDSQGYAQTVKALRTMAPLNRQIGRHECTLPGYGWPWPGCCGTQAATCRSTDFATGYPRT